MRIAHVTATFPPYQAGTGNVAFHNARELARLGHRVHVFTAALPTLPAYEVLDGIEVHRLRPLLQIGNAPLLLQLVRKLRGFDVVHLHYPFIFGAELVRLTALLHRIPVVVTLHNDLIGDGARAKLFAAYQQVSARLSVRPAALLCVLSHDHFEFSRLQAALGGKRPRITELPNGVDTDLFRPQSQTAVRRQYHIPPQTNLVLFVAALDRAHHFKGLDYLLNAFTTQPDTCLLVVGDGDLRHSYQQMALQLGIKQRVTFAGGIAHDDLPPFYRAADVTVLPSSPPESFGLVLVESMACGTPVIASDIPGVRTVVDHGKDGFLVEAGNVDALAAQLQRFFALDAAARQAMGAAGREKVAQTYRWQQIGRRLARLYEDVLHGRSRTAAAAEKVTTP